MSRTAFGLTPNIFATATLLDEIMQPPDKTCDIKEGSRKLKISAACCVVKTARFRGSCILGCGVCAGRKKKKKSEEKYGYSPLADIVQAAPYFSSRIVELEPRLRNRASATS